MRKLAVTMGDPAGIGPEVCLMLLSWLRDEPSTVELEIYGDLAILEAVANMRVD